MLVYDRVFVGSCYRTTRIRRLKDREYIKRMGLDHLVKSEQERRIVLKDGFILWYLTPTEFQKWRIGRTFVLLNDGKTYTGTPEGVIDDCGHYIEVI